MSLTTKYETYLLKADSKDAICDASSLLKRGELVAIPTETVYGLAANALDEKAVDKIFAVKGRPQDNPLIIHICDIAMWQTLVNEITPAAMQLAKAFWPGPLTIILPKSNLVLDKVTASLSSVAVRMPAHPVALSIIKEAGIPLAAPSANISGEPSPTCASHCIDDLWGKIPLIIDGGECDVGIESTIISLVNEPVLLRPGQITVQQIEDVLGKKLTISPAVDLPLQENEPPISPGMKYKHYSPKAHLVLLKGSISDFLAELERSPPKTFGLVFEGEDKLTAHPCVTYGKEHDADSQSKNLFFALRALDEQGAKLAYVRCPDCDATALGVYNRILRACAFEVKKL